MKNLIRLALTVLCAGAFSLAQAAPPPNNYTDAGTVISNVATVDYEVNGVPGTETSPPADITVDELVDVDTTFAAGGNVVVSQPDTDRPMLFQVTNIGNAAEIYDLGLNVTIGGDDFDPTGPQLYLDDGDQLFEPGADDGAPITVTPSMNPDASRYVWVVADIPGSLTDGDIGIVELTATAQTGTGAPGAVFAGAGAGGVDAVVGANGGDDADQGSYEVSDVTVALAKVAAVTDQFAGTSAIPGATITYTLTLTVTGSGTAEDVVITDPIPADTTYVNASIELDGNPMGDGNGDADECDHNATTPGVVTCDLGDITGPATRTVVFEVTID
jgi:uncharacterized repeat protein (TIGR01451 family)